MLQTLVVYTILLLSFIVFPAFLYEKNSVTGNYKYKYWGFPLLIPILIFSFIEGFRYEVGVDWHHYRDYFKFLETGNFNYYWRDDLEILYVLLNKTLVFLQLNYVSLFILESFLLIYAIYYFFRDYRKVCVFAMPLFFMLFFSDIENLSRQFLAISIFLIATKQLLKQNYKRYFLLGIVAALIHSTCWLFLPIFFVLRSVRINKLWILLAIYLGLNIASELLLSPLIERFSILLLYIGKGGYADIMTEDSRFIFEEIPLRTKIIWHLIALFIIFYGYKLLKQVKRNDISFVFIIAFIGLTLKPILSFHELFARINLYFYTYVPLFMAFLYYYVFIHNKGIQKMKKLKIPLILLFFYFLYLYFGRIVIRTNEWYPFLFVWD